ncbi:hypothetical protein HD806DRAFT_508076 [Xylariaceae sp. AK1471]|nr:hypothetical protein HD806DRAFT_508076 [Xylariaceae sp. AK1471]
MQFLTFTSIIAVMARLASGATIDARALPKANEYKSGDCSGDLNFGHHSGFLFEVTMDDTTNSVFLSGQWDAFEGKSGDGGTCTGLWLGDIGKGGGCKNLNDDFDGKRKAGARVRCVRRR